MRHQLAGCSRFCLPPSSDNLGDHSAVGSSLVFMQGLSCRRDDFQQSTDGLEKHLTRRANHRHIIIIAKIVQSPGGEIRRGLFV
jgi:hypothetical protein